MTNELKKKSGVRPQLTLLANDDVSPTEAVDHPAPVAVPTFSNLEKFQELVKDIVSFEVDATTRKTSSEPAPVSLTRARVSSLENIRLETPSQVMRMINSDLGADDDLGAAKPGKVT